ncbi:hypothetical protein CAOG_00362 [Capsaspora owczarzaki ATCC 30864]|uniref:Uncharacterized protein n=1 Tax=Capsaspora owczarzaki (strain ATCC 30864) TaxID=595528 RepID=A0A0D2VG32_CAPO3|nr:hypothetical protein CAOG_00362 [Capsaspora owczarzaki ATCC 30864]KJE88772.1 hypothetical protein CAOG_000362 [Capsaspora owczarzaki ATCC 30864]|eukprot:XP_004365233.1 hypothetical protein CAOG_00362 [Capsaspora owczarzaki ATCC 30864]
MASSHDEVVRRHQFVQAKRAALEQIQSKPGYYAAVESYHSNVVLPVLPRPRPPQPAALSQTIQEQSANTSSGTNSSSNPGSQHAGLMSSNNAESLTPTMAVVVVPAAAAGSAPSAASTAGGAIARTAQIGAMSAATGGRSQEPVDWDVSGDTVLL